MGGTAKTADVFRKWNYHCSIHIFSYFIATSHFSASTCLPNYRNVLASQNGGLPQPNPVNPYDVLLSWHWMFNLGCVIGQRNQMWDLIFRGAPSGTEFDTTTPHSPKQLYTYIYISFDSTYTFFFYIPLYFLICRYPITMAPMEKGFSWSNIAVGELAYFIRAPQHPLGLQRCCSLIGRDMSWWWECRVHVHA